MTGEPLITSPEVKPPIPRPHSKSRAKEKKMKFLKNGGLKDAMGRTLAAVSGLRAIARRLQVDEPNGLSEAVGTAEVAAAGLDLGWANAGREASQALAGLRGGGNGLAVQVGSKLRNAVCSALATAEGRYGQDAVAALREKGEAVLEGAADGRWAAVFSLADFARGLRPRL
ncbi:MAG: hypothetical protein AAB538_04350, partial [Patescibacteria group bacterium]